MEIAGISEAGTGFKKDLWELQKFVDKYVEIIASDGTKFLGKVFTIDPLSNTIVLVQREDETIVDIIMGHAIQSITVLDNASTNFDLPDNIFESTAILKLSEEETVLRKNKLKSWLLLNKIPVTEDGNILKLQESIEFLPPYGKNDCRSLDSNELILGRILDLLEAMPE